ncbi:MAG: TonB-dependent receptor, partial [Pseudomonadales bacterium]
LRRAGVGGGVVLSGGAGGGHGSGALAGVINIVLDDAAAGGRFEASFGQRRTAIEGVPRFGGAVVDDVAGTIELGLSGNLTEDDGDGNDLVLQGSWGFALGDGGFMRLSAEYQDRNSANRAGYDARQQYPLRPDGSFDVRERTIDRRRSAYGDPALEELNILFNAAMPVGGGVDVYGFTFLGTRNVETFAPFVRAVDARNVPALYPDGFLPKLESDIDDRSFSLGLRGEHWGWRWDLSYNQREDEIDLSVADTLNPTFGAGSPRSFVTGNNETQMSGFQLDVVRGWQPSWLAGPLILEAGVASASEEYEVETGDLASYFDAGLAGVVSERLPAASVGFAGFASELENTRDTDSAYAALRAAVTNRLDVSLAARYDDLDDLGGQFSADLGAELKLVHGLLLRAAAGRGFHAPALAQSTYNRAVRFVTPAGSRESGVYAPDSAEAAALGGGSLNEETAEHASVGLHYAPGERWSLSVDAWQVDVEDRVVLSPELSGGVVTDAMAAAGLADIDAVQFALNGADVRTRGIDARAGYRLDVRRGVLDLDLGVSRHTTRVDDLRSLTTAAGDAVTPFGDRAAAQLEAEHPELKLIARAAWQRGPWDVQGRLTRLGAVTDFGSRDVERFEMDAAWLLDLDLRYRVNRRVAFGVGVHNLLNEYPDVRPTGADQPVEHSLYPFSGYAPFNAGGRLMYARMSATFD